MKIQFYFYLYVLIITNEGLKKTNKLMHVPPVSTATDLSF